MRFDHSQTPLLRRSKLKLINWIFFSFFSLIIVNYWPNRLPVPEMELLFIELKSSNFLILLLLNGSLPMIKGSNIPWSFFVIKPVFGSIFTKLIPEGILKVMRLKFILAFSIKFLKIGTATAEPVGLYPKLFFFF